VIARPGCKTPVAADVVELELTHPDGLRLPDWAPGAHLDVVVVTYVRGRS